MLLSRMIPFSDKLVAKVFSTLNHRYLNLLFPSIKSNNWHYQLVNNVLPIRKHGSSANLFSYENESRAMEIRLEQTYEINQQICKISRQLSKLLQCSKDELYNLLQSNNKLSEVQIHDIEPRVLKLKLYGIENTTIKQNIWILSFSIRQLSSRLELLKQWKFTNLNNAVSLLKLPSTKLKRLTIPIDQDFNVLDGQNKITYFSTVVQCHEKQACDLFMKYPFMLSLHLESFKEILSMAKGVGVLTEDLMSDPWLFRYSPRLIENRIELLDEIEAKNKCKVIKPWMLRCPQNIFNRYFELKDENIAALGSYTNLKDLLSNELELSDMEVEEMFVKHPPLAKISYSKAKEMIDFLKAEGFGSKMIYQVPRVLCHKQATLLARMLELKKVNPRMMSLQNLCRNKKDYLAFLIKVQGSHP